MEDNKFVLSKPIDFEGETITELVLDFESLTGDDILSAERQYNTVAAKTKDIAPVKELSKSYLVYIVARATKQPAELFNKLPAKDFSKLTVMAQNFLLI